MNQNKKSPQSEVRSVEKEKIAALAELLTGLTSSEWARVKRVVDSEFNFKAAKATLDDSRELKHQMEVEFNLRRFGDILD